MSQETKITVEVNGEKSKEMTMGQLMGAVEEKLGAKKSKKDMPFDPDEVKAFAERLFTILKEIKTLQEDVKELKLEFKEKINMKLISKIIRLTKIKISLLEDNASDETVEEVESIIRDHIGNLA